VAHPASLDRRGGRCASAHSGPPLATLACIAVAYLVSVRVVALVARHTGATVPPDLEPVLAVVLLGVTTDYSVFFLAGMRARLAGGMTRVQATRGTTAEFTPIIVTAGLVVTGGIASLTVANVGPLRAFGPALALTVRLQQALAGQPGVADVLGPASVSATRLAGAQQVQYVVLASSGTAARFGVIERTDPLGAVAIDRVRQLRQDLPSLARRAGLTGVRVEVGGETFVISGRGRSVYFAGDTMLIRRCSPVAHRPRRPATVLCKPARPGAVPVTGQVADGMPGLSRAGVPRDRGTGRLQ